MRGPRYPWLQGGAALLLVLGSPLTVGGLSRASFPDHFLTNAAAQKAVAADARKIALSFPDEHATFTVDQCHHILTPAGIRSRHTVDCRVTYLFAVSRVVCRSTTRVSFRSARSSALTISYPDKPRCS